MSTFSLEVALLAAAVYVAHVSPVPGPLEPLLWADACSLFALLLLFMRLRRVAPERKTDYR